MPEISVGALDHDAFIARIGRSLRCVAPANVFGSWIQGRANGTMVVLSSSGARSNRLPLRLQSGHRDMSLSVHLDYEFLHQAQHGRRSLMIRPTQYLYELLDRNGREIMVFHWHPGGQSTVRSPHAHASGARPIQLPARPNGDLPQPLDVSNAHIPTGYLHLEEVLLMLIRDLGVQPASPQWEEILATNLDLARG